MRNRVVGLRTVPASDLRGHPKNWRTHPPAQQQALRAMMERIGNATAIIARETPDGLQILDGHLRQDIAGDDDVKVLVVDLDDEESDAFLATVDPLAAMAEADKERLVALLAPLEDMPAIDWSDLYGLDIAQEPLPPASDDVVEPVADPVTQRGEVWDLGKHRLMCGDATSPQHVEALFQGASPECVLTDPPYSSGGFQEAGRTAGSKGTSASYKLIQNDRVVTGRRVAVEVDAACGLQHPVHLHHPNGHHGQVGLCTRSSG